MNQTDIYGYYLSRFYDYLGLTRKRYCSKVKIKYQIKKFGMYVGKKGKI